MRVLHWRQWTDNRDEGSIGTLHQAFHHGGCNQGGSTCQHAWQTSLQKLISVGNTRETSRANVEAMEGNKTGTIKRISKEPLNPILRWVTPAGSGDSARRGKDNRGCARRSHRKPYSHEDEESWKIQHPIFLSILIYPYRYLLRSRL